MKYRKRKVKELNTCNQFCGAGSCEVGIREAIVKGLKKIFKGVAINHWSRAVETMRVNFPEINTVSCKIEEALPDELIPPGKELHVLWSSPSCFTAGHLVTTTEGQKPIESVRVGDVVLTHKGHWKRVIRTQIRPSLPTVIAKGSGHFGIECTPSHHFLLMPSEKAFNGRDRNPRRTYGIPQWMRIDRAMANEALWATPVSYDVLPAPELPEPLKELKDPWWVIGRWIGDGWCGKDRHADTTICCPHDDAELATMRDKLSGTEHRWCECSKRTVVNFTLTNSETRDWMIRHFGTGASIKQVPSWCLTLPETNRRAILAGYLSADGYKSAIRTEFNTVSKKLAISMRLLAESLGYRTSMVLSGRKTYNIEGRTGTCLQQYKCYYKESFDERRSLETLVQDGKAWSKVRSVTPAQKHAVVYNLEVEDDNSYVLDGIVVHNCVHFSSARGGRPKSKQDRALAEYVTSWAMLKHPWFIIVENVAEFMTWGPLTPDGHPDPAHKGETFAAWVKMLESLGYNVEHRVLNCADYGDATTRKRFFLIAVRTDIGVPVWPKPTHGNHVKSLPQWRSARECLDFADIGKSIFGRKVPLSEKTLARLAAGAQKYWGIDLTTDTLVKLSGQKRQLKPFIVKLNRGATTEDVDSPLTSVLAGGNHHALVQAKPFIAKMRSHATAGSVDEPLTTVTAHTVHHAMVTPFLVNNFEHNRPKSIDEPLPSLTTGNHVMKVTPQLLCDHQNHGKAEPPDKPMRTVSTHDHFSLATLVLGQHSGSTCRSSAEPMPTVCTRCCARSITPLIVDNANGGVVRSGNQPLNTVTAKDNHMLYLPMLEDGRRLDIMMRMLKPRELARAHSLPDDFILTGTKTEQIKQVGNGVPARTARALVETLLKEYIA